MRRFLDTSDAKQGQFLTWFVFLTRWSAPRRAGCEHEQWVQFGQRRLKSVRGKPIHSGWIGAGQGNVVGNIPAWPLIEWQGANGPVHGAKKTLGG
jgi:hypothetical protein